MVVKLNFDTTSFHFIGKSNVSINFFHKDSLYLLRLGKEIPAKNFYFKVNNFFYLNTHTIQTNTWTKRNLNNFMNKFNCSLNKENMVLSEIESFRNFRKSLLKTLWWIILTLTVWETKYWPRENCKKFRIKLFCNKWYKNWWKVSNTGICYQQFWN